MLFKMCTCTKDNKKTVKYCVNLLQIDQEQQDKKTHTNVSLILPIAPHSHTNKSLNP